MFPPLKTTSKTFSFFPQPTLPPSKKKKNHRGKEKRGKGNKWHCRLGERVLFLPMGGKGGRGREREGEGGKGGKKRK